MTLLSRRHLGNVGSSKEKRIWVIREKEIKAKRNSRKRENLVRRTNEKRSKTRRTEKCPVLAGEASSGDEPALSILFIPSSLLLEHLRTSSVEPSPAMVRLVRAV